ncbi:hypothetical protein F4818DRAFT_300418 [Hypoxylon cercidicola]|nr:hypothetical protein F4818DRAFT_300418 [Hypoxylon cercidicola]
MGDLGGKNRNCFLACLLCATLLRIWHWGVFGGRHSLGQSRFLLFSPPPPSSLSLHQGLVLAHPRPPFFPPTQKRKISERGERER